MRNFQEKRRWRDILSSRLIITPLFLVLIAGGVFSFRALMRGWETAAARDEVEAQIRSLEEEREQLVSELEEFRSGRAIEREAREKLNLRRPGEEVIIIVDDKNDTIAESVVEESFGARLLDFTKTFFNSENTKEE